ncbi:SDR family oxidoreductase [Candidatus Paracaedibacter symbiosus]|uniref:SDR family oxidoreductase n=1 Tax=Candidatus Paracaedibacter symbiosus TaxID=244582 RepID=UPI000509847A|nr:SDR family oxidoreductase [Candidatus Paracaedibacter symbiosus]
MPQTVLITGAAKRIGRGLALDFAANGFDVCVHYHASEQEAGTLAEEIRALGRKAYLIQADLSCEKEVCEVFSKLLDVVKPISVLVNNASTFKYDSITSATRNSWDYHLEPNLRAPFILAQDFANQTKEGLILNIIDQRVWNLTPHYITYSLSKVGLWGLTQTLALALAPTIRVNAIGPGPTLRNENQTEAQFAEQCRSMPLRRGGSIEEICAAARFFLSAPSVTGQMIAVDGGQHLGWAMPKDAKVRED